MRDTPKLLPTILLTLACALPGILPATAGATSVQAASRVANSLRGHGKRRLRHSKSVLRACRDSSRRSACAGGEARAKDREAALRLRALRRQQREQTRATKVKKPSSRETAAATIAAVLATACQNTELQPSADNLPLVRAAVLCLVNRVRAEHDESPLEANAQLEEAAEGHCQELIALDYFAHVSPSGETPVDRIQQTGYVPDPSDGYVIGENLAWGTYTLSTPQSIVAAWIASPGHLANILESRYSETGVAITPAVPQSLGEGNPGATYAQEFGVIIH